MDKYDQGQAMDALFLKEALNGHKRVAGIDHNGTRECVDCEEEIPEKRRCAMPSCTRCIDCQEKIERMN